MWIMEIGEMRNRFLMEKRLVDVCQNTMQLHVFRLLIEIFRETLLKITPQRVIHDESNSFQASKKL